MHHGAPPPARAAVESRGRRCQTSQRHDESRRQKYLDTLSLETRTHLSNIISQEKFPDRAEIELLWWMLRFDPTERIEQAMRRPYLS